MNVLSSAPTAALLYHNLGQITSTRYLWGMGEPSYRLVMKACSIPKVAFYGLRPLKKPAMMGTCC